MSVSVAKVFSLLVVSGNGQKCNQLRASLHDKLIAIDPVTGKSKTTLFKSNHPNHHRDRARIGHEAYESICHYLDGIDRAYYGPDYPTPPVSTTNPNN